MKAEAKWNPEILSFIYVSEKQKTITYKYANSNSPKVLLESLLYISTLDFRWTIRWAIAWYFFLNSFSEPVEPTEWLLLLPMDVSDKSSSDARGAKIFNSQSPKSLYEIEF